MHQTPVIAPSILAADFTRLGDEVRTVVDAGASVIHVDVMDGRFVPNITMGAMVVSALRRITAVHLDVHLMIEEPERYVQDFAQAGADTISVHLEASPHLHRTLQLIRDTGCRVGVAINPHSHEMLLRDVLPLVDLVNVMTVNPGFGGQSFITDMMTKIANLRAMVGTIRRNIHIEVDGGINAETIQTAVQSGADWLVAGTAVFGHKEGAAVGYRTLAHYIYDGVDEDLDESEA
jgi:ribulose-phosphate 3-epimerase